MRPRLLALTLATTLVAAAVYWKRHSAPLRPQPHDVAALQMAYRQAPDTAERVRLLRRAAMQSDRGVARWLAGLAQADATIAVQASSALGAITNKAEATDLLELAREGGPLVLRANAVRALARTGGPSEARGLATLLEANTEPLRIRQEAALALGSIGDPTVVSALIATIGSTGGASGDAEQLRISALQALGRIGAPEAQAFLARYGQARLSATERAFLARAAGNPAHAN
jgi:HEAT repeat protein